MIITLCFVVEYYQRCPVSDLITNVMCRRSVSMSCFVVHNYQCFREAYCLCFTLRMEAEFSAETMLKIF